MLYINLITKTQCEVSMLTRLLNFTLTIRPYTTHARNIPDSRLNGSRNDVW